MDTTGKNRTFTLVVWGLCLVVLSLGGFFLYRILLRDSETMVLAGEAQEEARKSEQVASVRTILRESKGALEEIDAAFLREDSISSFIDSLENLAAEKGISVSLGSISVDPIPNAPSTKQLRIRASSAGDWGDLVSFVDSLEALPRAVSVQKLSMSKDLAPAGTDKERSTRWGATFDISALVSVSSGKTR